MKRERLKVTRSSRRERLWLEVLPLDPGDELVVRAKEVRRSEVRPERGIHVSPTPDAWV